MGRKHRQSRTLWSIVGRLFGRGGGFACERGQVLVFAGLLLVPLCGMVAAVVDVGSWYGAQRRTQLAADATVLAAATALPSDPAAADTLALDYAQANGHTISTGNLSYSSWRQQNDTITVHMQTPVSTFFSELFGVSNVHVVANASARVYPLSQVTGASPFGIVNTQPQLAG